MPPRGRTANTSLLAVLGGGDDFSEDEFQATGNISHMLTPLAKQMHTQAQRPGTRTRTATAKKGARAVDTTATENPTLSTNLAPRPERSTRTTAKNNTFINHESTTVAVNKAPDPPAARSSRRIAQVRAPAAAEEWDDFDTHDIHDHSEIPQPIGTSTTTQARATRARKRAVSAIAAPVLETAGPGARIARGRATKVARTDSTAAATDGANADTLKASGPVRDESEDRDEDQIQLHSQLRMPATNIELRRPSTTTSIDSSQSHNRAPFQLQQHHPPTVSSSPGMGRWRTIQQRSTTGGGTTVSSLLELAPAPVPAPDNTAVESRLRQQVAEANAKLEELECRYNSLAELATKEAEMNFERLQQAGEQQSKIQEQLIGCLRQEIALFKARTNETTELERRVSEMEDENDHLAQQVEETEAKMRAEKLEKDRFVIELNGSVVERGQLLNEVNSLSTTLQMVEKEKKGLLSKLAAAREGTANGPPNNNGHRPVLAGGKNGTNGAGGVGSFGRAGPSTQDSQALKMEKLKMELYCDLTNLLIHGIKSEIVDGESSYVYDCSQTGTNGTLRFQLSIPIVSSSVDLDQVEITYTPLIDVRNDKRLLEVLPDYLQDEIVFRRDSLTKFYKRILDSLEVQPVMDGSEDGSEEGSEEDGEGE